jgi:hypothetical protein
MVHSTKAIMGLFLGTEIGDAAANTSITIEAVVFSFGENSLRFVLILSSTSLYL